LAGDLQLLLDIETYSGRLLAIPEGGVKNEDTVSHLIITS
jgi:hypothetical protein